MAGNGDMTYRKRCDCGAVPVAAVLTVGEAPARTPPGARTGWLSAGAAAQDAKGDGYGRGSQGEQDAGLDELEGPEM